MFSNNSQNCGFSYTEDYTNKVSLSPPENRMMKIKPFPGADNQSELDFCKLQQHEILIFFR